MKKILALSLASASMLFSSTLQEIKTSGVLKVGIRENIPPFVFKTDDGKEDGYEVALAEEIAKSLGISKIEYVSIDKKDRTAVLNNNEVDLLMSISKTPKREKVMDFSVPYMSTVKSAITRKDDHIKTKNDLASKRVIAQADSSAYELIEKEEIGAQRSTCGNTMDCINKIKNNEADAYVNTNLEVAQIPLIEDSLERSIKDIGDFRYTCIGIAKGNKELREAVDNALLQMAKKEKLKALYNKYFEPFYKGTLDPKYIILDDLYKTMF